MPLLVESLLKDSSLKGSTLSNEEFSSAKGQVQEMNIYSLGVDSMVKLIT